LNYAVFVNCSSSYVITFTIHCSNEWYICKLLANYVLKRILSNGRSADKYVNISLSSQDMKFAGEWTKRTSHKLYILSSRLIFFQNQSYSHSDDIFIILNSKKNMDIWYINTCRYLYLRGKNPMIQNMCLCED
jgi:hypothetical protein